MKKSRLLLSSGGVVALASLGIATLAGAASYAEGANTEVNLVVLPTISITATENLNLEATPTVEGKFTSGDISVNVITNSQSGYKLYLSSSSEGTALENFVSNTSIPTISSAVSSNDMDNNTWGYTLSDTFNPVPASSAPDMIKETSTAAITTADVTTVTIGAKVDTTIPSGDYTNTLLFTGVANSTPPAPTNWAELLDLEYMQDMTSAKCAALPTPSKTATETSQLIFDTTNTELVPELVLIDKRDNKQYVTRKLADGSCWMTQNLDLDGGRTLTNEDSDLNDRTSYYMYTNQPVGTRWSSRYYDNTVSPDGDQYLINGITPSATGELYEQIGNYYTWAAATANSGTNLTTTGAVAASSICPKNWQLPEYEGNKSWNKMIDETYRMYYEDDDDILRAKPFTFVRSGFYEPGGGTISSGNSGGSGFWTNTVSPYGTAYAAILDFYPHNGSNPQNGGDRSRGFAIRCVAR